MAFPQRIRRALGPPGDLAQAAEQDWREILKVWENRLCRAAQRQGMRLIKSRRRDPRALDYGRYWLVMIETNGMVTGGQFGASREEVEEFLIAERS